MTTRVMLIRHAEKPDAGTGIAGVTPQGREDADELSVRGWQRAGALARFFATRSGNAAIDGISTPAHLFAAGVSPSTPSRRSPSTLAPLAGLLGTFVRTDFGVGQEPALAAAIAGLGGTVLVAWEHKALPALAMALGAGAGVPSRWTDDRFDMVWTLSLVDGRRTLRQVPQMLLEGDRAMPIR